MTDTNAQNTNNNANTNNSIYTATNNDSEIKLSIRAARVDPKTGQLVYKHYPDSIRDAETVDKPAKATDAANTAKPAETESFNAAYEESYPEPEPLDEKLKPARVDFRPHNEYVMNSVSREVSAKDEDADLAAEKDVFVEHDSQSILLEILDWIRYILLAVILGLLLSKFVIQRSTVVGSSMVPTLLDHDQLIVDKVSYYFSEPEIGDIVTINADKIDTDIVYDEMLVKRVIAGPGDTISFQDGKVIVNGTVKQENYLAPDTYTDGYNFPEAQKIPEGYYCVLGDNRGNSTDSRLFGLVPAEAIEGRVWFRIYPYDRFGSVYKGIESEQNSTAITASSNSSESGN